MTTLRLFMTTLLIGAGMLMSSLAFAQHDGEQGNRWEKMKEKRETKVQEIFGQLDLTDEQKQLLEANKQKHQGSKKEQWQQIKANMEAVAAELKKPDYDVNHIKNLNEQSKQIRNAMADERLEGILEVRGILTQEQFIKFTDLMDQHKFNKQEPKE